MDHHITEAACHSLCLTCNFAVYVTCVGGVLIYNIFPVPDMCILPATMTFPFLCTGENVTCALKLDEEADAVITQNTLQLCPVI